MKIITIALLMALSACGRSPDEIIAQAMAQGDAVAHAGDEYAAQAHAIRMERIRKYGTVNPIYDPISHVFCAGAYEFAYCDVED